MIPASEVFLISTSQLYHFSVYFLFALFSDEPQLFLPEYSQPAILHAAHIRRVVNEPSVCCNGLSIMPSLFFSISIIQRQGLFTNYREWGGGGHVKFYPYERGGGQKSHAERGGRGAPKIPC